MVIDSPREHASVLLVSDEPESAAVWGFGLRQADMEVCLAGFSEKTIQVWAAENPDIVILDDYKSGFDVIGFIRRLRSEAAVPLLLLTSRYDEYTVMQAYEAGIDDCLVQPVSPRLLVVKVKVWLRRSQVVPIAVLDELSAGGIRLNPDRRVVTLPDGKPVRLTNLETRLLYVLMKHPSWILETDYLVDRIWGQCGIGDSVLLKNLVYRLRRKIEADPSQPRYVLTENNLGYKFQDEAVLQSSAWIGTDLYAGKPGNGHKIRNTSQLHLP